MFEIRVTKLDNQESNVSNALADAVAKAMESGEPVTIGNGETHISTYVTPVHYQNNETMAAKVNLKCGDMVCDSIVLRKSNRRESLCCISIIREKAA